MMTKVAAHVEKEPEGVAANLLKMKGTRGNITQAYKEIVAKDRKAAEAVLAEMFLQTQKQQVESGEDGAEKSAAGMCFQGSCLDLIKEVPDSSIYLIHTDPPYGINFDILEKADNKTEMYQGDTLAQSTTLWTALAPELFRVAQADSFAVVWVSFVQMPMIRAEMEKAGWECGRKPFVWVKESQWASYAPSKWFASAYDTALIFAKGSPTLSQQGKPDFSAFPPLTPHLKTHPLERPVAMLAELMGRFLVPGQTVLDPFMGSGSTLLAALALKCNPIGFERDEAFFNSAKANVVKALKRG